ncbi:sensor histidine kinase [Nonomuraea sp. M3C6]|uniref:histidine kinase n=1 Tax=Nonomuraea marmarensis TaxID=3351344 RepID=A0ABW7A4Y5_9ACTN
MMTPWRRWSVRTSLTLATVVVMSVLCVAISVLILAMVHNNRNMERNRVNQGAATRVVGLLARNQLPPMIDDRSVAALQVLAPTGRIVSASPTMVGHPRMASFTPPRPQRLGRAQTVCHVPGFGDACLLVSVQRAPRPDGDWIIYAAAPASPWYVNDQLPASLLAGSVLFVAVTAISARRIVGRSLKPVDGIQAQLCKITSTDLRYRVPVPVPHDEIRDLACTVNSVLDLLETALHRERRLTANASHDLRSPITAMRTQIEEALLYPRDTDWPAVAQAVLQSLDRLQVIVTDLLQLTRIDAGETGAMTPVDLSDLVRRELARYPRAVNIDSDLQPALVYGHSLQLGRLLTNLLDNAERHASSTVTVRLDRDNDQAVLVVHDDGPGIPADQRDVVFQRFSRLDTAGNRDATASGLGLPIAREIAKHHGGTLTLEDSEHGARFVARIPLHNAQSD